MFFMGLLFLFILCYGVVLQAVRYPNATLGWPLVKNILFMPYFNIYGELFLEDLQGENFQSVLEFFSKVKIY